MFDFILPHNEKNIDQLKDDEIRQILVAIKRMLPRWMNSLPDSEYHGIIDLLIKNNSGKLHMVETGIGASTIALIHFAMITDGVLYSWDVNSTKASYLKTVIVDTLEKIHKKPVSSHWHFVYSSSLHEYTGLTMANEMIKKVDFSFHDSDHTWKTIAGEIEAIKELYTDNSIVCVDDANQHFINFYEPIINMVRNKAKLSKLSNIDNNIGEPHYKKLRPLLLKYFNNVEEVETSFLSRIQNDPYYSYYEADRSGMSSVGMELLDDLKGRFVALRLRGKK